MMLWWNHCKWVCTSTKAAGRSTIATATTGATLVNRPRDLYQFWQEWTVGFNGRKPARKDFTTAKRNNRKNNIKQKFYRCLKVWKVQARLIDGGMSIIAANNQISQVTGARTVTKVIDTLVQFNRVYGADGGDKIYKGLSVNYCQLRC
jgi:hypothetical protein